MRLTSFSPRTVAIFAFVFAAFFASAPAATAATDAQCYNTANAGTIGDIDWTGCAGMYIVADRAELSSAVSNGYKITHGGVDYTFGNSAHNVFTGQVTDMEGMFFYARSFDQDISGWAVSQISTKPDDFDTDTPSSWVDAEKPQWGSG